MGLKNQSRSLPLLAFTAPYFNHGPRTHFFLTAGWRQAGPQHSTHPLTCKACWESPQHLWSSGCRASAGLSLELRSLCSAARRLESRACCFLGGQPFSSAPRAPLQHPTMALEFLLPADCPLAFCSETPLCQGRSGMFSFPRNSLGRCTHSVQLPS